MPIQILLGWFAQQVQLSSCYQGAAHALQLTEKQGSVATVLKPEYQANRVLTCDNVKSCFLIFLRFCASAIGSCITQYHASEVCREFVSVRLQDVFLYCVMVSLQS